MEAGNVKLKPSLIVLEDKRLNFSGCVND